MKGKSYILTEGTFGKSNTYAMFVSDIKNRLQLLCKENGFKYNKNQDLYLKEDESLWREIETVDKIE